MKHMKNSHFLSAALVLCLAAFLVFAGSVPAAEDAAALVSVEDLGVNPPSGAMEAAAPSVSGDMEQSLSSTRLGGDPASENAFLLRGQKDLSLEFRAPGEFTEQGLPAPGEILTKHPLRKGEAYLFRHHVPEGMPNLLVCAVVDQSRLCWVPRFNGMDGSLELDPGFVLFSND